MTEATLGIVYNFHQSHAQMDRLKTVFPRLKPHLVALNLNGMRASGPRIETLGRGEREQEMIQTIIESGWRGSGRHHWAQSFRGHESNSPSKHRWTKCDLGGTR